LFEGVYAVGHAVKMDEVLVNSLPKLQVFIADWVKSPMVQSRLKTIIKTGGPKLADLEAQFISHLSETLLRVGYFGVKNNAWTNFANEVIPKLKESPLFNFMFEKSPEPTPAVSTSQKTN
jgi:hypothetical protein